jgi:A/G-specific adenine glycosylase
MKRFPKPEVLARASEVEVLKYWEGLGYYRRARMLHAASQEIVEKYRGRFPEELEHIQNLPGVGPYTLGAVASIALGLPQALVDGNVARVLSRWFGIRQDIKSPPVQKKLWVLAGELIPRGDSLKNHSPSQFPHPGEFNQGMMELGALICLSKAPRCPECPVRKTCFAYLHRRQEKIPRIDGKRKMVHQFEYAGLIRKGQKILIYQRSSKERMSGMWQFPSIVLTKASSKWIKLWKQQFSGWTPGGKLASHRYHVTHHRISLDLYEMKKEDPQKLLDKGAGGQLRWVGLSQAQHLAWISAHRKLATQFLNWPKIFNR